MVCHKILVYRSGIYYYGAGQNTRRSVLCAGKSFRRRGSRREIRNYSARCGRCSRGCFRRYFGTNDRKIQAPERCLKWGPEIRPVQLRSDRSSTEPIYRTTVPDKTDGNKIYRMSSASVRGCIVGVLSFCARSPFCRTEWPCGAAQTFTRKQRRAEILIKKKIRAIKNDYA